MSLRYKRRILTIEELSEITRRERRIVMIKKIRQNVEIRTHKIIVMQDDTSVSNVRFVWKDRSTIESYQD